MSTQSTAEDRLREYFSTRENYSSAQNKERFTALTEELFGSSEGQSEFRNDCREHGIAVVFRSGMSRQEAKDILTSPEAQQIRENPNVYSLD